jgi:SAM-dependent methyltransferase
VKRALSQHGAELSSRGDEAERRLLEAAFKDAAGVEPDEVTHGFHSYPARMHPRLARVILAAREGAVLDPFCGSGTVLVEAMVAGRRAVGNDLNPVALRVAEVKCARPGAEARAAFLAAAARVAERSRERVRARAPSRAPVPRGLVPRWDGHVLKELGGLWEEIQRAGAHARFLEVVLSSIVVKFSRQRSETATGRSTRRVGRFVPTDFFEKKCAELVGRWAELVEVAAGAPAPELHLGDARDVGGLGPVELVISSPPYGGTYDYARHHELRAPWLGAKAGALEAGEVGARRRLSRPKSMKAAKARWDREVEAFLSSTAEALTDDGRCYLVMGDGQIGNQRVPADRQLERLGPRCGLEVVAVASESRTDFRGGPRRREHLVSLVRA